MATPERSATQQRLIALLGPPAHEYLERLAADYIANILRQQQERREMQPPLRFKDPAPNE